MSRPLRIEYPDAWYHVINRARRGQILYVDTDDYRRFLDLLQDTADMFNILKKHSSVSSVIERTQNRLDKDRQFRKRVEKLKGMLIKGQTETWPLFFS